MRVAVEAWAAEEVRAGRGRYVREVLRAIAALAPADLEFVLLCREPWAGADLGPRMRWRPVPGTGPLWTARAARVARVEADVLLATTSYALPALTPLPSVVVVYDFVAFDRALSPPAGALLERVTLPPAGAARPGAGLHLDTRRATSWSPGSRRRPPGAPSRCWPPTTGLRATAPADPAGRRAPRHRRPLCPRAGDARAAQEPAAADRGVRGRCRPTSATAISSCWSAPGWRRGRRRVAGATIADSSHAARPRLRRRPAPRCTAGATPFAYVSLYEGFGLPVLEAHVAGAPVLTSDTSSMPEVGGDAVAYADPTSTASIRARSRSC